MYSTNRNGSNRQATRREKLVKGRSRLVADVAAGDPGQQVPRPRSHHAVDRVGRREGEQAGRVPIDGRGEVPRGVNRSYRDRSLNEFAVIAGVVRVVVDGELGDVGRVGRVVGEQGSQFACDRDRLGLAVLKGV